MIANSGTVRIQPVPSAQLQLLSNTSWQAARPVSHKGDTPGDTIRSSRPCHQLWRASGAWATPSQLEQAIPRRQQLLSEKGRKHPNILPPSQNQDNYSWFATGKCWQTSTNSQSFHPRLPPPTSGQTWYSSPLTYSNMVCVIELTVPWENLVQEAYERKKLCYAELAAETKQRGWNTSLNAEDLWRNLSDCWKNSESTVRLCGRTSQKSQSRSLTFGKKVKGGGSSGMTHC